MQVERAVRNNVASSTAIYMDGFVTPLLQDLVANDIKTSDELGYGMFDL